MLDTATARWVEGPGETLPTLIVHIKMHKAWYFSPTLRAAGRVGGLAKKAGVSEQTVLKGALLVVRLVVWRGLWAQLGDRPERCRFKVNALNESMVE